MKHRLLVAAVLALIPALAWADAAADTLLKRFDTTEQERAAMRADGVPVILRKVPPAYPRDAWTDRVSGCVVVSLEVTPGGVADNFQVLYSEPPGRFDETALRALSLWKFEPDAPSRAVQEFVFEAKAGWRQASKHCPHPHVSTRRMQGDAEGVKLLAKVEPYYPPDAVRAGEQGCLTVAFDIRPDGLADGFQAVGHDVNKAFLEAAAWALTQWRFNEAPGKRRGAATFSFSLSDHRDAKRAPTADCPSPDLFGAPTARNAGTKPT